MDVIFNIIVTIAIILFVVKRMKEVAQKGKDITRPPVPESIFREDEEEPVLDESRPVTAYEPPVLRRFEVPTEPPAPRRPAIPPETAWRLRRGKTPKVTELRMDESVFEAIEEEEISIREPSGKLHGMLAPASRFSGSRAHGDGFSRTLIGSCFSRDGLVKGVIMSEILGPPVGMRSN